MAHQAGFDNVVASLGTALTPGPGRAADPLRDADRARLRRRRGRREGRHARGDRARRAHRPAPGDDSGVKLEDVRVARLPDGKDPDEVVRESPDVWEAAVAKAKPLVEYLIGHHADRFDLKTAAGRIGFVEAVMPAIRDIADPLRRDEALGEVRRVSGVEERALRQVLERPARNPLTPGTGVGERPPTPRAGSPRTRSWPRRTRCRSTTSCARSRRSSRSCCGCCCSSRTSSCGSSTSSGRTSCRARSPASCSGRSSSSARPTTRASTRRSTARRCS